jgi:CubicO group peptidase (beta-lactamase class C family)
MADVEVQGRVEPGFERVRDAFAANFAEHNEVGAAFCLHVDGRPVVDLWGGVADETTGRPWEEDTLALVFSTTKGATAMCALLLAERGDLDLDAPVVEYWPEFGAEGKDRIPVRWLLSHRAGLPVVTETPPLEDILRWDPIAAALAASAPVWEPGTAHGYHALTYGWLVGEVVRRVSGRSLGRFFADEIAGPLGLDFWIGLPAAEEPRVARLIAMTLGVEDPAAFEAMGLPEEVMVVVRAFSDPESLSRRALDCSGAFAAEDVWNSPEVHAAEIPAANAITTARSLSRLYAACVGDVEGGGRLLSPDTVKAASTTESDGLDQVLLSPSRFGLGFMLPSAFSPVGGPASFGHYGAGGSLGYADADHGIGYGYVMNRMEANLTGDPRTLGLTKAVYDCL